MTVICFNADFTDLVEAYGAFNLQLPQQMGVYELRGTDHNGDYYLKGLTNPHVCIQVMPFLSAEISFNKERFRIISDEDAGQPSPGGTSQVQRTDQGS